MCRSRVIHLLFPAQVGNKLTSQTGISSWGTGLEKAQGKSLVWKQRMCVPPLHPVLQDLEMKGKVSAEQRLWPTKWREVDNLRSLQLISPLSMNIKHTNSLGLKQSIEGLCLCFIFFIMTFFFRWFYTQNSCPPPARYYPWIMKSLSGVVILGCSHHTMNPGVTLQVCDMYEYRQILIGLHVISYVYVC